MKTCPRGSITTGHRRILLFDSCKPKVCHLHIPVLVHLCMCVYCVCYSSDSISFDTCYCCCDMMVKHAPTNKFEGFKSP